MATAPALRSHSSPCPLAHLALLEILGWAGCRAAQARLIQLQVPRCGTSSVSVGTVKGHFCLFEMLMSDAFASSSQVIYNGNSPRLIYMYNARSNLRQKEIDFCFRADFRRSCLRMNPPSAEAPQATEEHLHREARCRNTTRVEGLCHARALSPAIPRQQPRLADANVCPPMSSVGRPLRCLASA